eukprot:5786075-Pyramimonas_sp.AAC.1
MPEDSPGAQFCLHPPLGAVPDAVNLPRHWEQYLRQGGNALCRLAWTEHLAAAKTVCDGSAKTRTELVRKKSCALEVAVTPINELSSCLILDKYNLRNAFPPQEGKL